MRRLIESGAVKGRNFVQVGLRGYWPPVETFDVDAGAGAALAPHARDRGARRRGRHRRRDRRGARRPGRRSTSRSTSTSSTRASRPGTGTPEPGGMLPREVLRAVRRIVGAVELAGMDIVEVSPPYDHAEVDGDGRQPRRARGDPRARGQAAGRARPVRCEACRVRGTPRERPRSRGRRRSPASTTSTCSRTRATSTCTSRSPRGPAGRSSSSASGAAGSPSRWPRRATTSPASTSTRRCSRGPAPRPRPPGATVAGRLDLVEGDARTSACPTPARYRPRLHRPELAASCSARARDQAAPCATLAAHLAPGGLAVVDIWLPDADDLARYDGRLVLEYVRARPGDRAASVTKTGSARTTRRAASSHLTTIFEEGDRASRAVRWVRRDRLRLVAADELRAFAEAAGLVVEPLAGGYDLEPLGPGADRAILVARGPDRRPRRRGRRARTRTVPGDGTFGAARRVPIAGIVGPMPDQIRLLVVEDVPQVAQYIRGLLNSQPRSSCSTSSPTGRASPGSIRAAARRRPRRRAAPGPGQGPDARRPAPRGGLGIPVIVLTVPQSPVEVDPRAGHPRRPVDAVLRLRAGQPRSSRSARTFAGRATTAGSARMVTVFAPKGGVGKTTIAFNLAVALGQLGQRTVLIDGSLQFGDLRALLKVPVDAPSILDLPTDRVAGVRPAGRALARPVGDRHPARPAAGRDGRDGHVRDIDKALSLLRRVYEVIVVDMPAVVNDINLAFLDAARHDPRDRHLRLDDDPQHDGHRRRVPGDRLPGVQGPVPRQPRRLDRRDRRRRPRARARPRARSTRSCSDGMLVVAGEQRGRPVRARRTRPRRSARTSRRVAAELVGARAGAGDAGGSLSAVSDPRPIGVFDSGVGGLTVLREILRRPPARIDDLPRRQRPRPVRRPLRRRGPRVLDRGARRARRARRQGDRRRLQHVDRRRPGRPPPPLRPAGPRRDPAGRGRGGPRDAQPARRRHRHAGHRPVARLLQRDQGREPGGRGLRARDAGASCRWSRRAG